MTDNAAGTERVLQTIDSAVAAYNAHDFDALRAFSSPDFAGFDHRPGSLGRYDIEGFIAFTLGLFAQVRTQHLVATAIETSGNAALFHTLETAETLDGDDVSFETLMVFTVVAGQVRSQDTFAPEAATDARAMFETVRTRAANDL